MSAEQSSVWKHAQGRGCSRRDFLQFCGWAAGVAGVGAAGLDRVVRALETKPRLPVVWFHFQECTCCSESFLRSSNPAVSDLLLDMISLDYSETLQAAAGGRAEAVLRRTVQKHRGEYLMMVEGSIPTGAGGVYCCVGGRTALDIVREHAAGAKAIVAWGNCATNGCVQAAAPAPTGAIPVREVISGKPIISVPGCPPIANVMAGTVVHLLAFDAPPPLDGDGRPTAYYSKYVHDECPRLPHYQAGRFAWSFDDENARNGYCLNKLGCRGPETHNACGVLRWNGGVGTDLQAGHPCIGCAEAGFWDQGPFYERRASFANVGGATALEVVGGVLGAGAVIGVAARAAAARLRSRVASGEPSPTTDTAGIDKGE